MFFPRYIPIKRPVEVVVGKVAIPDKGEVSLVSAISRNGEKVEVEKPRMRPNTEKPITPDSMTESAASAGDTHAHKYPQRPTPADEPPGGGIP